MIKIRNDDVLEKALGATAKLQKKGDDFYKEVIIKNNCMYATNNKVLIKVEDKERRYFDGDATAKLFEFEKTGRGYWLAESDSNTRIPNCDRIIDENMEYSIEYQNDLPCIVNDILCKLYNQYQMNDYKQHKEEQKPVLDIDFLNALRPLFERFSSYKLSYRSQYPVFIKFEDVNYIVNVAIMPIILD